MSAPSPSPVRVDGILDPQLSRWLWLVKWLLAIPHFIVLVFLFIAAVLVTIVAFFAILITGRYPRSLFDFNVGALRWAWRVGFYTYDGLGTDRNRPFTLGPAPDYPATLEIEYPERLSRGLVLVKWWLLAIPHYLLISIFLGVGDDHLNGIDAERGNVLWRRPIDVTTPVVAGSTLYYLAYRQLGALNLESA